jgi:hypothetical protein
VGGNPPFERTVPVPEGNGRLEKEGRFSLNDFSHGGTSDAYRCPAGELLRPMKGRKKGRLETPSGRLEIRYAIRKAICAVTSSALAAGRPSLSATYWLGR